MGDTLLAAPKLSIHPWGREVWVKQSCRRNRDFFKEVEVLLERTASS